VIAAREIEAELKERKKKRIRTKIVAEIDHEKETRRKKRNIKKEDLLLIHHDMNHSLICQDIDHSRGH